MSRQRTSEAPETPHRTDQSRKNEITFAVIACEWISSLHLTRLYLLEPLPVPDIILRPLYSPCPSPDCDITALGRTGHRRFQAHQGVPVIWLRPCLQHF